jgi:acyl carrier protein
MDDSVASQRVITLLIQRLGLPPEAVTPTAELAEDLGIDSVDAVEFALALERELNVSLPDKIFGDIRTVQDVIDIVRERSERLVEVDHN